MPTVKKSVGGPRTENGKQRSSQNAMKHGLTAIKPSDETEAVAVAQFAAELTDYYQPQSPVEKLQIERIAICRAKLARLYEVEQVRLQIAKKNIENDPAQIFKEMNIAKGLVREMALEGLRRGDITLPCDLTYGALRAIVSEIDSFHGRLDSESDLRKYFPALVKFLLQYPARGLGTEPTLLERFEVVIRRIRKSMRQDIYLGNLVQIFEEIMEKEMQKDDFGYQGVAELMQEIGKEYTPPEPAKSALTFSQLQSLLPLFVHLQGALKDAQLLIERYQESKNLLVKSAMLPAPEADLLMRYQTTLERRLSSSLGELLALQKQQN